MPYSPVGRIVRRCFGRINRVAAVRPESREETDSRLDKLNGLLARSLAEAEHRPVELPTATINKIYLDEGQNTGEVGEHKVRGLPAYASCARRPEAKKRPSKKLSPLAEAQACLDKWPESIGAIYGSVLPREIMRANFNWFSSTRKMLTGSTKEKELAELERELSELFRRGVQGAKN
jgi:hypothetical protein